MTDPDIRPVIDRALPQREVPMSAEEREEWGQEKPPRRAPVALGLCNGVGKLAVLVDGVLCCPTCGDPVADGCGSSRYKHEDAALAQTSKGER